MYYTLINQEIKKRKDFNEWRAEKLGYVYFSRLSDLLIKELDDNNTFFDYLIDVGESGKQTGRLFGVEVNALNSTSLNIKSVADHYKNVSFPVVLVVFYNKTDKGYFTWIKEPNKDGRLILGSTKEKLYNLDASTLNKIVREVKEWLAFHLQSRVIKLVRGCDEK